MNSEIANPFADGTCFFCGPNNLSGLKLAFHRNEGGGVFAEYTPEARFCGQGNIFHGGMQMGLLDEAMWWAGYAATGVMEAVTVSASFRFLRPVYIGAPIRAVCSVASREGQSLRLQGRILNSDGKVCTSVKGKYLMVGREQFESLVAG